MAAVRGNMGSKRFTGKRLPAPLTDGSMIEGRGVVYVKHVPHGFYESQMREYFKQFGDITRLRLSRSKKTGRSKGYAYVEFASDAVAQIAAKSMEDYLMFRQRLMCRYVDPKDLHPNTFKGSNRKFSVPKSASIARERHNRLQNDKQASSSAVRLRSKHLKRLSALAGLGITYDVPGIPDAKNEMKLSVKWNDADESTPACEKSVSGTKRKATFAAQAKPKRQKLLVEGKKKQDVVLSKSDNMVTSKNVEKLSDELKLVKQMKPLKETKLVKETKMKPVKEMRPLEMKLVKEMKPRKETKPVQENKLGKEIKPVKEIKQVKIIRTSKNVKLGKAVNVKKGKK